MSRARALILPALLALITVSLLPGATDDGTAGAAFPRQRARPAPALYRLAGCESDGSAAYLHGPPGREVAIGFDDGPWPDTAAFVSMLERNGVRATFFMIGRQVLPEYKGVLLRELRDGDVLGDHSFSHPDLTRSGEVRSQLARTIAAIRSVSGYTPCVFRPPYGAYNRSVVDVAGSLGLATVLWNVDPTDWAQPGTAAIEKRVLAQVRPGSIIISHDGGGPRGQTLAAYPGIIRALRARGYRIVTIPQMLGFAPIYQRCIRDCLGIGLPISALPPDAILVTDAAIARARLRLSSVPGRRPSSISTPVHAASPRSQPRPADGRRSRAERSRRAPA